MRKIMFAMLVLGATPAMAQDEGEGSNGGLRIEARGGIERPNLNTNVSGTTYVDKLGSSFVYGGEIGYDIPVSETVTVGPYASIDAGGSNKCEAYTPVPGQAGTACFHSKSDLSAGVRAGFQFSDKGELYLGLGYDSYSVEFSDRVVVTATNAVLLNNLYSEKRGGIGVSFGGNYNMSENVYIGLGMRITEAGKFEGTDISLQRFQGHVAIGFRM